MDNVERIMYFDILVTDLNDNLNSNCGRMLYRIVGSQVFMQVMTGGLNDSRC